MEAALEECRSLGFNVKPNFTQIAKKYGCDRSALSKRYRGICSSKQNQYQNQRLLNNQQEETLIKYIDELCKRSLPPSRQMIRNFAQEIVQKEIGREWVNRFLKRHQIDLVFKWSAGLDHNRTRTDSAFKYTLYFELLARKIEQYRIEPRNIYNIDEKGFLIGILSKMKRIFTRRRYEEGQVKQFIQDGNREWITTLATICADGTALSPALIYQAVSRNIQNTWLQDFDPKTHRCFFASSASGWTNDKIGLEWLEQVFDRETKNKVGRAWRLLILDGHESHLTMKFIDYCDRHRILLAMYPPHSTHTLQPLDVALFRPLSQKYSEELSNFMQECQGFSSLSKRDFFRLFWAAWVASFTQENIASGFEVTGLHPFNPDRVIIRFSKKNDDRPSSSSSTNSVLHAEDWKQIEKLLRTVVTDIYDKKSQQLSNTMHALSMENMLLKMQNAGLKKSLINEKKKRKRGKPLILDVDTRKEGGAIFFSPNKVQQARDRQAVKDAQAEANRIQKKEEKALREVFKAEKAKALEMRKAIRAKEKEKRLHDKEQKSLPKEDITLANLVNQQLQIETNIDDQDRQHQDQHQRDVKAQVIEDDEAVVMKEVDFPKNARGREIRLPRRFWSKTS